MDEAGGDPAGPGGDVRVGQVRVDAPSLDPGAVDEAGMAGPGRGRVQEDLGQDFVADQVGPVVAAQDRRRVPERRGLPAAGPGRVFSATSLIRCSAGRPLEPAPVLAAAL